eukprot:COSAG01_NODE_5233_length_4395_cov_932.807728_5_plen_67_part_00
MSVLVCTDSTRNASRQVAQAQQEVAAIAGQSLELQAAGRKREMEIDGLEQQAQQARDAQEENDGLR